MISQRSFHQCFLYFRRIILSGRLQTPHPFSISVFENSIFWSDWTRMTVKKMNKYNGVDGVMTLAQDNTRTPYGITVIHPVKQNKGRHPVKQDKDRHPVKQDKDRHPVKQDKGRHPVKQNKVRDTVKQNKDRHPVKHDKEQGTSTTSE